MISVDEQLAQMRRGVVGKYASGRKVVALDKDVVEDFPNEQAVNEALRGMLKIREIVSNLKTGKTVRRESA